MKVTHQLGQAGYLETVRGRNGGLRLGKPPDQIVVGEVVRKMEPDFAVVEFSLNKEETTMANYDYLIIGGGMTSAVDGIREVDPTAQPGPFTPNSKGCCRWGAKRSSRYH